MATYALYVDWNKDGTYTGSNEDVSSDILDLQWERARDMASQLTGRFISGKLEALLKDTTGKYASFNSASPLYGSLLPGRKVKLDVTSGTTRTVWSGFLERIEPLPEAKGFQKARLTAFGPLGYLGQRQVSAPMSTNMLTDAAIGTILDQAIWPTADRTLDTGKTTLSRWWADRQNLIGALRDVEVTEAGFLLETKGGKIAFENRHHRLAEPHLTSQGTFSDASGASLSYREAKQIDPLPFIFNIFEAQVRKFAVGTLAVLWTHPETGANSSRVTRNGGSITLWANYPNPDSPTDAFSVDAWTTPVATTDYLANSASDGGGTNLTSDIGIVATKFANAMKLVVTNNHATLDAYLTFLQARGTPVTQADPVRVEAVDSASGTTYGERTYPQPPEWLPNTSEAQAWADWHLSVYKDAIPFMEVTIPASRDTSHMAQVLDRDISDRITLVANAQAKLGINRDFFIEGERHHVAAGPLHETRWLLSDAEKFIGDFWVLNSSELGTSTKLAY